MRAVTNSVCLGTAILAWHLVACASVVAYGGGQADFDRSGTVNANDLSRLANAWLSEDVSGTEDMNGDDRVDLLDLARFARDWRAGATPAREPFVLTLGKRASWPADHEGYDPNLPGYHIVGGIASVTLHARRGKLPRELVLAIQTSPGMPPMLENFTLVGRFVKLSGEPFNPDAGMTYFARIADSDEWQAVPEIETDVYFKFEIRDDEVRVTFLPRAIELLRAECVISWIDWYR